MAELAELAELAERCWEQTDTKQDPNDPGHSHSTLNFPFPWTGLSKTRALAPGIPSQNGTLALHEVTRLTSMYVRPTCALFKPPFILKPSQTFA